MIDAIFYKSFIDFLCKTRRKTEIQMFYLKISVYYLTRQKGKMNGMNRTSLKHFFLMAVRKKNYFRQNGAPKFIQKNRVKWLMNWQHDATMKYYWTATTIAFIAHRQENEKEIVFYCYWRASNGIHFPWLENGFGMPFCFLNKSKGKGDKIPV